jgi:hypothetical protein
LTALAFLTTGTEPSRANGRADLHREGVVYAGPAAMFGLRVPFGGESRYPTQPIVGFSVGSSWHAAPGSLDLGGYRFIRSAELGVSFRGDPVLKLGSFDLRPDRLRASAEEGEASTFCGRNLGACLVIGTVGVVFVAAVAFKASGHDGAFALK